MKVAFQGERGAYSEAAAIDYFGENIVPVACRTFDTVFSSVDSGICDKGMIPVENSLAGSIHRNYDLLQRYQLSIVGEKKFRVRHCLITQPGVQIKDIRKVMSHPQALAQCEKYIDTLGIEREASYDTAGAVKTLSETNIRDHAAIASRLAAKVYNMQVLDESIEDAKENYTRFLALAREPKLVSHKSTKTSIAFTLSQGGTTPGSLFRAIGVFAMRDINLTKIESRPTPSETFNYIFYLDFEGSTQELRCQRALEHLSEMAPDVRVFGTYKSDNTI
ncbi:MAG TPA: prephenate dehydratase [Chloroflexi bacterium]|nr:prephenate dehydratase [Chloroflexota bacterium]|tara:strand:- start:630 stop:1460 length:831 start_codon:yes stop_codon:yes gene_type:complete